MVGGFRYPFLLFTAPCFIWECKGSKNFLLSKF